MNWDFLLARAAERSLRSMPQQDQARVNAALNAMKQDPFDGDVAALKGEYHGLFRRRVGAWRIIFELDPDRHRILVHDILHRSSTTY
ncbi:MAG TPA: type II toxin-antitoxin system RelE/ParE family toxin [Xanthobacteraceae bacterium]|nr:type II toxin-antitoxin system RelE/ParE family toxin [Xanthobacteraceae bacterium]